ncbi:hypothetical protein CJ030_MR7G001984 [Morella rubra]|uniref:Uncharacterized protein n=1 Tax=Morella rubra TaxID=262757 RepID=A0A6A1WX42_9ROSI|nr:hypothetical protein CJ030_MR7G001984 [Morella rubra]
MTESIILSYRGTTSVDLFVHYHVSRSRTKHEGIPIDTSRLNVVIAKLKEGINQEKVSPAFLEVSPITNGGVVLQNGMNENAANSLKDFITLDDLDDNFGNESCGQKNLASGFETPMNIVFSEDNGSCSGSNAEHGRVPGQYWANDPVAYSPECWESVFHNQDNISPPIELLGGSFNQIVGFD